MSEGADGIPVEPPVLPATPLNIQRAAIEAVKAAIPTLATCAQYAGEFSGGELSRASVQSPAVLVACLGITRDSGVDCGQVDWMCRFTAYCMVRHAGGRWPRAEGALELAALVLAAVDGSRFKFLTGVWPAKVTRLDNLYAEAFDKSGVALWAVTWEQKTRLGSDEWAESESVPTSLYIGIAPEIGAAHEDDYYLAGTGIGEPE